MWRMKASPMAAALWPGAPGCAFTGWKEEAARQAGLGPTRRGLPPPPPPPFLGPRRGHALCQDKLVLALVLPAARKAPKVGDSLPKPLFPNPMASGLLPPTHTHT